MNSLALDVRNALRALVNRPGYALTAVFVLALGIGVSTTVFTVVNTLLFAPLPYRDAGSLYFLLEGNKRSRNFGGLSLADYRDCREQNRVFDGLALYQPDSMNVAGDGLAPEQVEAVRVSEDFVPLLGSTVKLGHPDLVEPDRPSQESQVLISHGFWQRGLGGRSDVLGRRLRINGEFHRITGVVSPEFRLVYLMGFEPEIWLPLATERLESRSVRSCYGIARLKPGVSREQAESNLESIAVRLEAQYPDTNREVRFAILDLRGGADAAVYLVLLAAIGLVLLIACTNASNLLLARWLSQIKEISIRRALGAGWSRVFRFLMVESLLLSALGCLLGLLAAFWGCEAIRLLCANTNMSLWDIRIDRQVAFFAVAISALAGLFTGLLPALRVLNSNIDDSLKECSHSISMAPSTRRFQNLLVRVELAFCLTTLIAAGLVLTSWREISEVDPGFQAAGVLTMRIPLAPERYRDSRSRLELFERLLDRLKTRSTVEAAAVTSAVPLTGNGEYVDFEIPGRDPDPAAPPLQSRLSAVSADYFRTMGIPLRAGRSFTDRDDSLAPLVAIVNESLSTRFWGKRSSLGEQIELDGHFRTIVGVAGNVRDFSLIVSSKPAIYLPYAQSPVARATLVIKIRESDPAVLAGAVKKELQSIDPEQPVADIRSMERIVYSSKGPFRLGASVMGALAIAALLLSIIGVYGVLSYSVWQRTHEIGIRLALGARMRGIRLMVLQQGLKLILPACCVGLAGALLLGRLLSSVLYGVRAYEPALLAGTSILLILVALSACYIPAWRASRVDPSSALRSE